jgi:hypothetical protein
VPPVAFKGLVEERPRREESNVSGSFQICRSKMTPDLTKLRGGVAQCRQQMFRSLKMETSFRLLIRFARDLA